MLMAELNVLHVVNVITKYLKVLLPVFANESVECEMLEHNNKIEKEKKDLVFFQLKLL